MEIKDNYELLTGFKTNKKGQREKVSLKILLKEIKAVIENTKLDGNLQKAIESDIITRRDQMSAMRCRK